ncbi:PAS domain-containing protein [Sorangium sp. So ce233]|uniref:PAS domain-containing protein n=1 Tax=Sorangium sp. So ce233 TaxID=3133290 RepID=UPI003F60C622
MDAARPLLNFARSACAARIRWRQDTDAMHDSSSLTEIERENATLRQRVAELEKAQAKLEALCSVSTAFIAFFDRNGVVQEMFPTLVIPVEMTRNARGRHLTSVVREDYIERCATVIRESLATQTTLNIEYPVTFRDRTLWIQAACKPFTDDTVLWVGRDVTAQRQLAFAQAELRDFQALVESAPDGVCLASLEGALFYANHAFRTMTGHGDGALGKSLFDLYGAEEGDQLAAIVQQCFEQGSWQGTLALTQHDGRTIPCQVSMVALNGEAGRPPALATIARDLTPLHDAERERLALQEQVIQAQQATLRELSTPLVPLAEGVVAMPLIGALDRSRAQQAMERLLDGIVQHQFHTAILDVTGVKDVDAESADALLRIARAARLLGAQLVLTGIGPDTAQTLVDLGVDLTGIATRSTLQSAIAHALAPRTARADRRANGTPARPRLPA